MEQRQPSFLLDGSLLVTGEVDRTTEFEQGFPVHQAHRDGSWQPDPLILDDQVHGGSSGRLCQQGLQKSMVSSLTPASVLTLSE